MAKVNLGRVVGYSAYELALQNGYVGTEAEWVASLKGKDGKDGETGPMGPIGPEGPEGPKGTFEELTPEQKESLRGYPGEAGPQGPAGADYVITNADYEEIATYAAEKIHLYDYVSWVSLGNRLQDFEKGYNIVQSQKGMGEGSNSDKGVATAAVSSPIESVSLNNALWFYDAVSKWSRLDAEVESDLSSWRENVRNLLSRYSYGYLFTFVFKTKYQKREIGKYSTRELLNNDLQWSKSGIGPNSDWAIEVDLRDGAKKFKINSSLADFPGGESASTVTFEIWPGEGGGSSGGVENHIIRKNEFNSSISAFVDEAGVRAIVDEKLGSIANAEEGAF